jgi:GNAT superfamily N-acetyltransferase
VRPVSATPDAGAIEIRDARPDDRHAVLELLASSLNWVPDELFARFFAWKHEQNPFGPSPAWVATAGDRIVGFRTFVRWEFAHPDGRVRRAVRAVDTATHPEFQGQKVFSRLTLHALDELRAAGVDFVFNTPNAKSRPGYLKMGWHEVGRLGAALRPSGLRALARMVGSRVPADRWSRPSTAGDSATDVLAGPGIDRLLASLAQPRGLRTCRTAGHLRWRYGFPELAYRALAPNDDPAQGVAIFRIRTRGSASEAALCELLVPDGDVAAARTLQRSVARASKADYVIRLGASSVRTGYVTVPGQGPVLTWRAVGDDEHRPPPLAGWELQLGDVELF